MESLGFLGNFGSTALSYVVPFLFVLTIVVFFHELGHFLAARWCGVGVRVFSVGFGPELFGFNDRRGTRWRLSLIPLGGYVKFVGDENEASQTDAAALAAMDEGERSRAFAAKGVGARAIIVAAGPIANFVLAIVIFTAIFTLYGRQVTTPRVDDIVVGSPAERAGFKAGDIIVEIDGEPISDFSQLQRIVSVSSDVALNFVVTRGDETVALTATPERQEITDRFGNKHRVGILGIQRNTTGADITVEDYSPPRAFGLAVSETWFVTERTLSYLFAVVIGKESADQLGGPLRVAEVSAQVATIGYRGIDQSCGNPVDINRADQSFPDSDARRRPSPVFRGRGHSRPPAKRTGPGCRFPNWLRGRSNVNDFRNMERYYSFEFLVKKGFDACRRGNAGADSATGLGGRVAC